MNTTNDAFEDTSRLIHGFRPLFILVGYGNNAFEKKGIFYYLEISKIVNNKPSSFQPLSKNAMLRIRNAFDTEILGNKNIKKGWINNDIVYIDNTSLETKLIYWEKSCLQNYCVDNKIVTRIKPSMVFYIRNGQLEVYAYVGLEKPGPETDLYRCPFANTKGDNTICMGTAQSVLNKTSYSDEIQYWKDLYWKSEFSQEIAYTSKKFKYDHWIKAKTFRKEWLIPANKKLQEIIL